MSWLAATLFAQAMVAGSAGTPTLTTGTAALPAAATPVEAAPPAIEICVTAGAGGAPVPGATLIFSAPDGRARAETAGSDGCSRPADLAHGRWKLTVVAPGTKPKDLQVTVPAPKRITVALELASAEQEMTIEGKREAAGETRRTIAPEIAATIPGTQGDALKAVQDLPGLARTPFGLGGLIVRGSAPQDTKVFLDGQEIPQLYHFGGLTSVVATDVLSAIDFLPGGFGVRYGVALGGVVDVSTRAGRDDRMAGMADVDIYQSEASLQGPVGGSTFIAAGRRSYIDFVIAAAVPSNLLTFTVAPRYYDYQLRWDLPHQSGGTQMHALAYGSDDEFSFVSNAASTEASLRGTFYYRTLFHRGQLTITRPLAGGWILTATPGVGLQDIAIDAGQAVAVDANRDDLSARVEARGPLLPALKLLVGTESSWQFFGYSVKFPDNGDTGNGLNGNYVIARANYGVAQGALYAEGEADLGQGFTLVPGIRLDGYEPSNHLSADPRVSLRFEPVEGKFLRTYLGLYQQPPDYQYWDPLLGNPGLKIQSALQTGVGGGLPIADGTTLESELFYKWLWDLVVNVPGNPANPSAVTLYDNSGIGRAYGLELLVKRDLSQKLYGWIAYTLSKSERANPYIAGGWHPFEYDQTHILTVITGYKLRRGWEIGLRYRDTSGNTYTPAAGAIYDSDQDSYLPLPGGINSGRLPAFNQLDVRFDKRWEFRRWKLDAYLDIQNATNNMNPEGMVNDFDWDQSVYINDLPILPAIGLKGEF